MKLFKYIYKEVVLYFLIVFVAMSSVQYFVALLNELGDTGKGHYNLANATLHCLFNLPGQAYDFLPIMIFMGGLLAFGELVNHNELVIMRCSGLKNSKLFIYVMCIAMSFGISLSVLFESVAPWAQRYASYTKDFAISKGNVLKQGESFWMKEGSFFIHAKTLLGEKRFKDVWIYQINRAGILNSAAYMKWLKQDQTGDWVAESYRKSTFLKQKVSSKALERVVLPMHLENLWLLHVSSKVLAEEMNLFLLWKRLQVLQTSQIDLSEWLFHFCERLAKPFISMIMLILTVPLILGSARHQPLGYRLTIGLMLGLLYHFLNKFLYVFAMVYQVNAVAATLFPIVFFILLGTLLWSRVKN